ncbi:Myg1p [Rhodotorula paludigena]|uniref:Myg1p n=1 Tax=Rhodotorula paludigena TaxID=86838 RepID=UPI0031823381
MSEAKKPRTTPILCTHSGTFHADDALAAALLRALPQYAQGELRRSRDPKDWDEATVVFDVCGEYAPDKLRFDHHQRGFNEVFGHGFVTKLSSAGMIYKHFGQEILSTILNEPSSSPTVQTLFLKMYSDFVEAFDGIDNGIAQYVSSEPARYRSRTDISSRVAALNPRWNEPSNEQILLERFEVASKLCDIEFRERLDYLAKAWLPAREFVQRAVEKRKEEAHPSGKVVIFSEFAPWKEHLHILEQDLKIPEDELPLYVLYPESEAPDSKWRVQAVAVTPESFESRKALPEAWRGVRDDALSTLTGIPGCIFVHAAGFIGGNATKEGAMQMAIKALEL